MNELNAEEMESIDSFRLYLAEENSTNAVVSIAEYKEHLSQGLHKFSDLDFTHEPQTLLKRFECYECGFFPWEVSNLVSGWLKDTILPADETSFLLAQKGNHDWSESDNPWRGGVCLICLCHADSVTLLGDIDVMLLPLYEEPIEELMFRRDTESEFDDEDYS